MPNPESYREEWRSEYDLYAQREMARWTYFILIASGIGVAFTGIGIYFVARTLNAALDAVEEAKKATDAAVKAAEAGREANEIARQIGRSQTRAYVSMSHRPPGVYREHGVVPMVKINIKNSGQTPATVTAIVLTSTNFDKFTDLPRVPPYNGAKSTGWGTFVLAPGSGFNATFLVKALQVINTRNVVVYGYVDYIDVFRTRHRARYARIYDSVIQNNNLSLFTYSGWNLDYERKRGEGDDWDENPDGA